MVHVYDQWAWVNSSFYCLLVLLIDYWKSERSYFYSDYENGKWLWILSGSKFFFVFLNFTDWLKKWAFFVQRSPKISFLWWFRNSKKCTSFTNGQRHAIFVQMYAAFKWTYRKKEQNTESKTLIIGPALRINRNKTTSIKFVN